MQDLLQQVRSVGKSFRRPDAYAFVDVELGELHNSREDSNEKAKVQNTPDAQSLEEQHDEAMEHFFTTVDTIKADMQQISKLQQEVHVHNERSKTLIKSRDVQQSRKEMQEKIDLISTTAYRAKARLEALDKANEAAKQLEGQEDGTARERTRTAITAGLMKKLKNQMGEFSSLRNRIQDEYREVVGRRIYTVTGSHIPDDEIDRVIESGAAESIFQKAIVTDQARGRVLDTLAEIEERHRAVKDLEQSLLELHQIFLDMAQLVEVQGEKLDSIEKQVERCRTYVHRGVEHLGKAKESQTKTRKLKCWMLLILVVVVLVIVLAVVQPWRFAYKK